jgi:cysteine sulfinate desulfinase
MMTITCPKELKKAFPFFASQASVIYLDTAATAQKPACVIETMSSFLSAHNAPVNRGAYTLSYVATEKYENARKTIAHFIGSSEDHLIFTKGATEGLNLLSNGLKNKIKENDEILVLETEHHANLLPWQKLAEERKAILIKIPVLDSGHIDLEAFKKLLNPNVKIIACAHMSNVTGCIQPLNEIAKLIQGNEAYFIVDGAQGIAHQKVDVSDLNLDAYVFSSHKLYGPTGLGVLHVSSRLLETLDLYQVGGDVIESVSFEKTIYKKGRGRFEAGTPMVAEVLGLEAAVHFLSSLDLEALWAHEAYLISKIKKALLEMPGIHLLGSSDTGVVSFYSDHVHALDLATYLDTAHIAIRSGHLCAQPTMHRFHTSHAARISCGLYTTEEEIDKMLKVLESALVFFN